MKYDFLLKEVFVLRIVRDFHFWAKSHLPLRDWYPWEGTQSIGYSVVMCCTSCLMRGIKISFVQSPTGSTVINFFFISNSAEHEIYPAYTYWHFNILKTQSKKLLSLSLFEFLWWAVEISCSVELCKKKVLKSWARIQYYSVWLPLIHTKNPNVQIRIRIFTIIFTFFPNKDSSFFTSFFTSLE